MASTRTKLFEGMPTTGLPQVLINYSEFQKFMRTLVNANTIDSIREVWWDIRPHPGFGTVEIRAYDAVPSIGEIVNLVAVVSKLINEVENVIQSLNTIDTPVVMAFGQIAGGHTFNVIPSKINLRGSVRYLDVGIKKIIQQHIRRSVKKLANETGAKIEFKIPYSIPAVINNRKLTAIVEQGAVNAIGKDNVVKMEKSSMGSDDFGFYIDKLPCSLFRIGSSNGQVMDLHVSDFDVDENCIRTAIKVLHHTIREYFK